jgi:hypothetical protein
MNTQTMNMLDELKAVSKSKLNQYEREQLEEKYADDLPLHSGTISYTPDLIASIIDQVERHVQSWEHASTITDIPHAPDLETCQRHIKWGREVIEYLRAG